MTLTDLTLLGTLDKVGIAIERIQAFEPDEGYFVAFSGGKDSIVTLDLILRSGVQHDAHFNVTTVDPPEVLRFIREHYPDVAFDRSATSMYKLIVKKRYPPTRMVRYCCEHLKERGGIGRVVVTGIRAAESAKRSRRKMMEGCYRKPGSRTFLHPIIEWSDDDVWEYIHTNDLPYPSLYDEGQKRIGCVMCPMGGSKQMKHDAERWPKFAAMYRRACRASYDKAIADGLSRPNWKNGDDMYEWWIDNAPADDKSDHLFMLDN